MTGQFRVPRRIVTGHDADGVSVVLADGPVPITRELPEDGVAFHEVWATEGAPASVDPELNDPTLGPVTVPPPPLGTRIRINEFLPGHLDERQLQSPVHRTQTIDYGIVLEGEITLILDKTDVVARAGDIVIQRGTDHAWANRSDRIARVAFVLVDGTFTPELLERLPADVASRIMRHGPRDQPVAAEVGGSDAS